jgi:hypothetical protein
MKNDDTVPTVGRKLVQRDKDPIAVKRSLPADAGPAGDHIHREFPLCVRNAAHGLTHTPSSSAPLPGPESGLETLQKRAGLG